MNNTNKSWRRFNKYLYKYWKLEAVVIFLGLATIPLTLINPYLTKLVIDKAYGNKDLRLFFILAIIGGSIFIINGLINSLSSYFSEGIDRKVNFDITRDLFKRLQKFSLVFFNERSTGEHIFRISSDVRRVSDFVCNTIPQMISLFPRFLFILVIIFYLNWKLALFASLLVPLNFLHPYFFGRRLREITSRVIEKSQDIFRGMQEVFSHIHLVKALGREDYEIKRFQKNLSKRIDSELRNVKLSSISRFSSSVLNKVLSGIVALYGGYQVIKGTMSLGSLSAVMIYLTQLMGMMKSIGEFHETIIVNSVSVQRLSEILDIQPEIEEDQRAIACHILRGKIEFRGVCFGYKKDEFSLRDLNFLIKAASKIALTGPSGCGKTTLLALILRLYELKEGSIFVDDLDIRDIKLEFLKQQIGIALQEPFLWNDTIAANILYGSKKAGREEMVKAAGISEAHNFIMNLPKQYDSIIGEMACKISEGQKQRIAMARAIIKRPKILMLDEAMSSVDSETEDRIIDNILRKFKDSTVIIVSHRLSTVKKMGLVYFLENPGRIVVGTHEELIERNLKYKELFASQINAQPLIESTEKVFLC